MRGKEIIRLDARVLDVLAESVFRAELANGHDIVAYVPVADRPAAGAIRPGDSIEVEMSPYDMSQGRVRVAHK